MHSTRSIYACVNYHQILLSIIISLLFKNIYPKSSNVNKKLMNYYVGGVGPPGGRRGLEVTCWLMGKVFIPYFDRGVKVDNFLSRDHRSNPKPLEAGLWRRSQVG